MPRLGEPAPQFSLPSDGGGRVSLSDYAGKKVVLYFYPKDDTPGCTKESCDFRDNLAAVQAAGAEVIGVSPDSAASHDEFKAKFQLPFPLLVDDDHAVAEAYGAWKEKTLYGRTFMGLYRTTVLIDEEQRIAGVWNHVQVDGHAQHVLAVLKGEQPAPQPIDSTPSKAVASKAVASKAVASKAEPKVAASIKRAGVAAAAVVAAAGASLAVTKATAKKPSAKRAAKKAAPKKAAVKAKPAAKKTPPKKATKKSAGASKKAPAKKSAAKKAPKAKKTAPKKKK